MTGGSKLEIEFRLGGAGWADIFVRDTTHQHEINGISYVSDALDDLVRLGIDIATHRAFGFAQFIHEPGSTILFVEADSVKDAGTPVFRLSAANGSSYDETSPTWSNVLDLERQLTVEVESRDQIARAILAAAERIECEHGPDGYSKQWGGRLGFPSRAVAALRAALDAPGSIIENWGG